MVKRKASSKSKTAIKKVAKNSLVNNINKRKKAKKSRSKKKSTVSPEAYKDMQQGWPDKKKTKKSTKTAKIQKSATSNAKPRGKSTKKGK